MIEGQVLPDEKSIENIKTSVQLIEGLFHAVNAGSFPLKWHDAAMKGMNFLNQMHSGLVFQLPKEEIEKMKAENGVVSPPVQQPIKPEVA